MVRFAVIDAPSILGLWPSGVEHLPEALKNAGLMERLAAVDMGRVESLPYDAQKDPSTLILNPQGIREYSLRLAEKVAEVRSQGYFPVVLGGDCSILIGCMLALRHSGRYGLFFIDGHADFYQPEAEVSGEVASMELAIVSGRGPEVLTYMDGLKPLVQDEHIVAFGYRDLEEQKKDGSQDIKDSAIHALDLWDVRKLGSDVAAQQGIEVLRKNQLDGFWIHLDADVLNDAIMPAVDYRIPDGLNWDELDSILKTVVASGQAVGITITIFNPRLDADGSIAAQFTQHIVAGLRQED